MGPKKAYCVPELFHQILTLPHPPPPFFFSVLLCLVLLGNSTSMTLSDSLVFLWGKIYDLQRSLGVLTNTKLRKLTILVILENFFRYLTTLPERDMMAQCARFMQHLYCPDGRDCKAGSLLHPLSKRLDEITAGKGRVPQRLYVFWTGTLWFPSSPLGRGLSERPDTACLGVRGVKIERNLPFFKTRVICDV